MFFKSFGQHYTQRPAGFELVGIFITDVYKYAEKIERKNLASEKKVQTPAHPDKHQNPTCSKPLLPAGLLWVKLLIAIIRHFKTEKFSYLG